MRTGTWKAARAPLAVVVAAMIVLPIAVAGASGPEAETSASKTKRQLKALKKRVAALEGRDSLPPSGPAGGDLTGTYPLPQIGEDRIGSPELLADGVGSSELKGVTAVVGPGVTIEPGQTATATVTCPPGQMVIGGGFEWVLVPNGAFVKHSSPNFAGDPNTTWSVRGSVIGGLENTLHAEANCLAV
jgi:hypothetical protein